MDREVVGLTSPSSVNYQLKASSGRAISGETLFARAHSEVLLPDELDDTGSGDDRPTPRYVPLVGRIAAGGPILAEESVESVFHFRRAGG